MLLIVPVTDLSTSRLSPSPTFWKMMAKLLVLCLLAKAVGAEFVVRVRLGNGAMRRVAASTAASLRREAKLSDGERLYLDEACTEVLEENDDRDLAESFPRGSVFYARRRKSPPKTVVESEEKETHYDPYPEFRLDSSKKKHPHPRLKARVSRMEDVEESYREILAPESLVCTQAQVASMFAKASDKALAFGKREGTTVICEAFGHEKEADVAKKLGLSTIGCVVRAEDKSAKPTASAVIFAAKTQCAIMRSQNISGGQKFPFVLLMAADDGSALEAYEVSEQLVQLVSEDIVFENNDLLSVKDAVVKVQGKLTESFDAEWVYKPVPIVGLSKKDFFSMTPTKNIDAFLRQHVLPKKKQPERLLTSLADFRVLLRLRELLTPKDFDILCDVLKRRRTKDPTATLPKSFGGVLQILAAKLDN